MKGAQKGQVLVSPTGTKWTVIKTYTRGWGGERWHKMQSERGAIRHMLAYEFDGWKRL